MPSIASKILEMIMKYAKLKGSFTEALQNGAIDKWEVKEPPKNMLRKLQITSSQVNGRNCFTLQSKRLRDKTHILYLHGGGYIFGINKMHWNFLLQLAQKLQCTIIVPDYPLAPANTHKDVFAMLQNIYEELVAKVGASNIVFIGDSAGGGMALALAQKLLAEKLEQPAQIILLSPWLDLSLGNPEIAALEAVDPILGRWDLEMAGNAYAGNADRDNYLLSPINGELSGLAEISIFTGTKDILLADAKKLYLIANEKGIKINYFEYQDMLHDWLLFQLPEAKKALEEVAQLVDAKRKKS